MKDQLAKMLSLIDQDFDIMFGTLENLVKYYVMHFPKEVPDLKVELVQALEGDDATILVFWQHSGAESVPTSPAGAREILDQILTLLP